MSNRPKSRSERDRRLRQRAEARLARQGHDTTALPMHDLERLVYELQVHQIELELQNEELRRTHGELEASHSRYVDLYEFAPVGYLSLDAGGVIQEANLTGCEVLGLPRARLLRRRLSDFVAADQASQDTIHLHRQRVFEAAIPCTGSLWMQRQDGTPFYAQLKSLMRRDAAQGPPLWRVALIDLTAMRRQAEAQLAWHAAIVNSSRDAIIGKTLDGTIVSWNAAAERLYGYRAQEVIGRAMDLLVPPEHGGEPAIFMAALQRDERIENYETQHLTQDGTRLDVSLTLSPIGLPDGSVLGASVIVRDITLHKQREAQLRQTEQALRQSQTQLRHLIRRQEQRQEQERKRIAQEIHDELAQSLTILHMDLAWLADRPEMTVETQARMQAMDIQVEAINRLMHQIAMDLRPPLLDDLGLSATLEWQVEAMQRRTGLSYTLDLPPEPIDLEIDRATVLFRIFQEALTNVVRHAEASHIEVRVTQDAEAVCLEVRDNGKGLGAESQTSRQALGVLGMCERAALWGGKVDVSGQLGSGTTVTVHMPYKSSETLEDAS